MAGGLVTGSGIPSARFLALINKALADVVGIPPDTLDTIQKIATALGDDPQAFADLMAAIDAKASPQDIAAAIDALALGTASTHPASDFDTPTARAAAITAAIAALNLDATPPIDGQVRTWSATSQLWVPTSFGQVALAKITAPVALSATAFTAIPGLSAVAPAGTKAPFTVRAHIPEFSLVGTASAAGSAYAVKTRLFDGANGVDFGEFDDEFVAASKTITKAFINLERIIETTPAVDITYSVQAWYTGAQIASGALQCGDGIGTDLPPAWIRISR